MTRRCKCMHSSPENGNLLRRCGLPLKCCENHIVSRAATRRSKMLHEQSGHLIHHVMGKRDVGTRVIGTNDIRTNVCGNDSILGSDDND